MLLVTDFERGGTPLRIARLARWLREAGADVCAGCLARPGPVSAELAAAGVPTFSCDAACRYDVRVLRRLSQHVRRMRPHLIHASLMHANVAARLVGRRHDVAVVSSTATIEVERRWHRWLERATSWMDSGHMVNSAALAEHVVQDFGVPRQRVYIVPPSLEALPQRIDRGVERAKLGIAAEDFVVAWAGRFDPVKRLEIVVRCAERLATVPARFLLAGDGPERPRIERMLAASPAGRRVQLLGWCDDMVPVLSAADAFLFPSLTEGMPNAVLEALACGLPVVASDIPALRELAGLAPEQSPSASEGPAASSPERERRVAAERMLLVAGDRPDDFAAALLQLHNEAGLALALGERAAAWAREHLSPQATVEAVLGVYQAVLRSRPPFAVPSRRSAR